MLVMKTLLKGTFIRDEFETAFKIVGTQLIHSIKGSKTWADADKESIKYLT